MEKTIFDNFLMGQPAYKPVAAPTMSAGAPAPAANMSVGSLAAPSVGTPKPPAVTPVDPNAAALKQLMAERDSMASTGFQNKAVTPASPVVANASLPSAFGSATATGGQIGATPGGIKPFAPGDTNFYAYKPETPVAPLVVPPANNQYWQQPPALGNNGGMPLTGTGATGVPGAATAGAGDYTLEGLLKKFQSGTGAAYNPADTSSLDAQIAAAQAKAGDTSGIDSALAAKLAQIDADYARQEKATREESANNQAADFSNLAGVGAGFNPLSSGGKSVASANASTLDKFLMNINARKAAEIAQATDTAYGRKNEAASAGLQALIKQRDTLKTDTNAAYERDRNKIADTISQLNAAATLAKQFDPSEKDKTTTRSLVDDTVNALGSKAFAGSTPEALALLEKAGGYPAGYISMLTKGLADKERQSSASGKLQEVGGNLYNITYDEKGNPISTLVQGKAAAGGAGGQSPGQMLSAAEKKTINSSDDAKTLKAIQNVNDLLDEYEKTVKDVGIETFGTQEKQRLEQLQGLMTVEYKNLAQLGALSGPDMGLVASITPNATTQGFMEGMSRALPGYSQLVSGKTQGNVLANIENLRKFNQKKVENAGANLNAQYQGKENDPYIQSLLGKNGAPAPQGETMVLNGITYVDDGTGNFVPAK